MCTRIQKAHAGDYSALVTHQLEKSLSALNTAFTAYKVHHPEFSDQFSDALNLEEVEATLSMQMDTVEEAELTGQVLLDIARILPILDRLKERTSRDGRQMGESPDKSFDASLCTAACEVRAVKERVDASSFPHGHEIRDMLGDINAQLVHLQAKEIKPPPSPTAISAAPAPASQQVQLPKIDLPTFEGDLLQWATIWSQFRAAVDDNPRLSNANKLAYLRDAIRDPTSRQLLYSGTEQDGYYNDH